MAISKDVLAVYDQLVEMTEGVERKGKTVPYTSDNGYMFSLVNKESQIGIRLSKEDQKTFIEKYDSGPFHSHGATMRDYVRIPENLHAKLDLLSELLKTAQEFVKSLPPK